MKKLYLSIITLLGIGALAVGTISPQHVAPAYLYPNVQYTWGIIETSSLIELTKFYGDQTYSQSHRNVPDSEKKAVCNNYAKNCTTKVEIDHFIPVALGGSNSVGNLWAQPEVNLWNNEDWGFHKKDRLETYLVAQMKHQAITPAEAQKCIKDDWVACYKKEIGTKVGAIGDLYDNEDDVQ